MPGRPDKQDFDYSNIRSDGEIGRGGINANGFVPPVLELGEILSLLAAVDVVAKGILLLEKWIWNNESFPYIIFCTPFIVVQKLVVSAGFQE